MDFSEDQINRYARHIILQEVGGIGQARLLRSRVLVIGAGGLGSPLVMYLAAAGVGVIAVVDDDVVDLSNLQRQVLHTTARIGQPKVESAAATVAELNPDVDLIGIQRRFTSANAARLIADYDVVVDGSDNFDTRFLVTDVCYLGEKPLVSAAILRFEGQISTYKAYLGEPHPCYRCIFPEPPPPGLIPSCSEGGVLGALAGVVGSLQAVEVIKELLDVGESLSGSLLIYDGLNTTFRKIKVPRDPDCPLCGAAPTIRDLSAHAA